MALSSSFLASSSLCVPQTANKPLCVQRSRSVSQTASSLKLPLHQATRKFQYQPLKSNKRLVGSVKALQKDEEKELYTKNVEVFSNEHLLNSLAHDVIELSQQYIDQKGYFSVALADTSSIRFLRNLVSPPDNIKTIDWSKWQFFWVEEEVIVSGYQLKRRLLPNELLHKLVYDEFLNMVARTGNLNVVTIDYELTAKQEASERYEKILQDMVAGNEIARSVRGIPKFDLMLLGMGGDGRVGSLIPDHPVLAEEERWVTHVKHGDETRLTLTLPVINSCSNISMVVSGSNNANAVYYSLMDEIDPQAPNRLWPAKRISPEGNLRWYLDKDAASRLFKEELRIEKRSY